MGGWVGEMSRGVDGGGHVSIGAALLAANVFRQRSLTQNRWIFFAPFVFAVTH